MYEINNVNENTNYIKTNLLARVAGQECKQLIENGRKECDGRDQLYSVSGFENFTSFQIGRNRRWFRVQNSFGVNKKIVQVRIARKNGRNQLIRDGEYLTLSVDPCDVRPGILNVSKESMKNNYIVVHFVINFVWRLFSLTPLPSPRG